MVSVIIPCYNYGHLLPDALGSLQKQTYSGWECIIVDNNSSDNTRMVANSFILPDSRIKYFQCSEPGPSSARNLGIEKSKGEYIQFLDADDLLEPKKFESAISLFHQDSKTDLVYSGMRYFQDGNKEQFFTNYHANADSTKEWMSFLSGKRKQILPALLLGNIMVISAPLIKRSMLDKVGHFDPAINFNEDWDLWLRFALADAAFLFDPGLNTKSLIRLHSQSQSRDHFNMLLNGYKVCFKTKSKLQDDEINDTWISKIKDHKKRLNKFVYKNANSKGEILNLLKSIEEIDGTHHKELNQIVLSSPLLFSKFALYLNWKFGSLRK